MTALPVHDTFSSDYAERYIKQDQVYIESVAQEYDRLQKWHIALFQFLESRREPLLLKSSQVYRQLKDGQHGISDMIEMVKTLRKFLSCQIDYQQKIKMFDASLHDTASKCPDMTVTAQSDPSLLQLAALTNAFYNSYQYNEEAIQELDYVLNELKDVKNEHALDDIFLNISKFEDQKKYSDERLLKFQKMIQLYQRKQHDFRALTVENKERGGDLFLCRQKYCRSIIKAWKYHMKMCRYVNDQADIITKANLQRQQFTAGIVKKITTILLKFYTTNQHAYYQCHAQQAFSYIQSHQYITSTGFFTQTQPLEPPVPPQIDSIPAYVVQYNQATYDPNMMYSQISASAALQQTLSHQSISPQHAATQQQPQQQPQAQQQPQQPSNQPHPDTVPVAIQKNQYNIPQAPKAPIIPEDFKSTHSDEYFHFYTTAEQAENPFGLEEYHPSVPQPQQHPQQEPQQQPQQQPTNNYSDSLPPYQPQSTELVAPSSPTTTLYPTAPTLQEELSYQPAYQPASHHTADASANPPVIAARPQRRPAPDPSQPQADTPPPQQQQNTNPFNDYDSTPYPAPAPLPDVILHVPLPTVDPDLHISDYYAQLPETKTQSNLGSSQSNSTPSLFRPEMDLISPFPNLRIRQFNLTPHPIRVNTTIPPKPAPQSAKSLFSKFKFDISLDDIIKRSRRIPPPGPIPPDSTILAQARVTKKSTFSSDLSAELIYTKSHQVHLIKDKVKKQSFHHTGRPRPPIQAIDDDDDFDYDQYVKTYGEIELTLDGPFCASRASRKEHNRLVVMQFMPGKFTRDKEFKCYMADDRVRDFWVNLFNTNNKFDPKYAPTVE